MVSVRLVMVVVGCNGAFGGSGMQGGSCGCELDVV